MKRCFLLWSIVALFQACKYEKKQPDVSGIQVSTIIKRFDRDFFAIDTTQIDNGLNQLNGQYPDFLPDYLVKILGINPLDPQAPMAIGSFLNSYRPVYETADKMAQETLPALQKKMESGLRYLKYYVPDWNPDSPFVITTFIGPMDAFEPFPLGDYGDVRTRNGVGIALQFHLGADARVYESGKQAGLFYDYQVRRFTPETMVVNCLKNVIVDAFPYKSAGNTLIEEMIEKGKRLYLLELILPGTADSLKLGYTDQQLKGCLANEALIWNYFVKNDLLYSKDVSINQNYIKDGPKTPELGEGAPGYIGLFVGLQVVKEFMNKNPGITITALMNKDANEVLSEAKYKP